MDYRDRLNEIFERKGPSSLRILFDCDSNEWQMVSLDKKLFYLEKMLASGYSLGGWITEYKDQYMKTHKHIIGAIPRSITFLMESTKNEEVRKQIKKYIDEN